MKAEYEQARKDIENFPLDYYVCGFKSYFKNDIKLKCCECNKDVFARIYHPRNIKIICVKCVLIKVKKEKKK